MRESSLSASPPETSPGTAVRNSLLLPEAQADTRGGRFHGPHGTPTPHPQQSARPLRLWGTQSPPPWSLQLSQRTERLTREHYSRRMTHTHPQPRSASNFANPNLLSPENHAFGSRGLLARRRWRNVE